MYTRPHTVAVAIATGLLSLITIGPIHAEIPDFKQPDAYAVVIGISQYREEIIPKVAYAVKDAQAMASLLETQAGIPKTHIRLLTDSRATGNDLRSVGDWLRIRVKPNSTVYVYYSGHGTPNSKTGEAYLVPWDGHPDYPAGLYSLKELYATLNKLPAKEIIILLDSCFSGAIGRSILAKGARPMVLSMENPLLADGKVVVLAAATGNQISSDYDEAEHGLFTYELLNGLQGEADANHDGIVTLQEVFPYVREHVAQIAADELNREQTPVLLPAEEMLGTRIIQPITQRKLSAVDRFLYAKDKPRVEEPKPIQESRARPYESPRQAGKEIMGKDGAPMALVPAGDFLYGDANLSMSLSAFYMDKFEVTRKLYALFLLSTRRKLPYHWNEFSLANDGDRPVTGVTWDDSDAYCRYYGKRLPTEQEWEKAARGTDGRKYPWGNEEPNRSLANYLWDFNRLSQEGYSSLLAPVESYEAGKSPYGIYHMAGNVSEWTSSDDVFRDKRDKVIRGGAWWLSAEMLGAAYRAFLPPSSTLEYGLGFRCVQDFH